MKRLLTIFACLFAMGGIALPRALAQAPDGPMIPPSGMPIQKGPAPIKIRSVLVNTPGTVRNEKGEIVHDLEESDFLVTDNSAPAKNNYFKWNSNQIGKRPVSTNTLSSKP